MDYFVGIARWTFLVAVTLACMVTSGIGINGF